MPLFMEVFDLNSDHDEIKDAFPLITWHCSGCLKPLDVLSCDSKVVVCECGVVQRLFSCFISGVVDFKGDDFDA